MNRLSIVTSVERFRGERADLFTLSITARISPGEACRVIDDSFEALFGEGGLPSGDPLGPRYAFVYSEGVVPTTSVMRLARLLSDRYRVVLVRDMNDREWMITHSREAPYREGQIVPAINTPQRRVEE